MARRCTDSPGQDPQLSRKRTADMLRQLRNLGKDARMLKARIETALDQKDQQDGKPRVVGTEAQAPRTNLLHSRAARRSQGAERLFQLNSASSI